MSRCRQLLCCLRKLNQSDNTVAVLGPHSKRTNYFGNSDKLSPYAQISRSFRGEIADHVSTVPIIRRPITVWLGSLKDMRDGGDAFIRNIVRSYYNRFSGFRRYSRGSLFSSHDRVVWSLIGVNIAVFFLWRHADRRFMENNFKVSVENFLDGRVHTLFTSAFSHIRSEHLLSNMIGLYFFGSAVGSFLGAEYLLKLYLAGALGGSIMFLINQAFIVPWLEGSSRNYYNPRYTPGGLGASGAVNAIILLDIFLFPKAVHYLNFFIPVPAMLLGAIIIGRDLWKVKQGDTQISGAAHLGGALVAAFAWAKIKRPWI